MRIEIQWNSLFPLSMPYVTTLQYQEIFGQNGSLLYGSDTAKHEFFMRLQLRLQSLHKHDFISNQLLFYCWLTQQHFNFSVSFSFNLNAYTEMNCYFGLLCFIRDTIFHKIWKRKINSNFVKSGPLLSYHNTLAPVQTKLMLKLIITLEYSVWYLTHFFIRFVFLKIDNKKTTLHET